MTAYCNTKEKKNREFNCGNTCAKGLFSAYGYETNVKAISITASYHISRRACLIHHSPCGLEGAGLNPLQSTGGMVYPNYP